MRRALAVLACAVLAACGAQLAHVLAFLIVEPSAHARAHALAETGHGYLRFASAGLGLAAAVILLALFVEIRATRLGDRPHAPRFWAFAAIAPATFVCQEHLERLLHDGAVPWAVAAETTFLIGLALQLPVALLAYLVARVLVGIAVAIAVLLARRSAVHRREAARQLLPRAVAPPARVLDRCLGPRGPPAPATA